MVQKAPKEWQGAKKLSNIFNPFEKIEVEKVIATRELVDAILACNMHNRSIKARHVKSLAEEIKSGNWQLTAQGIGISEDGILIDGQHRLSAIREAGYPPVPLIIVRGLKKESQSAVDRHSKRSMADVLTLAFNRTISNQYVAALSVIQRCKGYESKTFQFSTSSRSTITDGSMFQLVEDWADEGTAMLPLAGSVRASVMAALLIYARLDMKSATEFAEQVSKGIMITENDPAYRLRIIERQIKGGSEALGKLFALSVSACIAHANGDKIKVLRESLSWERINRKWK